MANQRSAGMRTNAKHLSHPLELTQPSAAMPLTPLLRWAGSKRKVVPILAGYWGTTQRRYIEPFAGSAALFFHLRPHRAVLSDINSGLIEAYEVIRERPDDLHEAVARIPQSRSQYYRLRSMRPERLTPFNRVVRFVYLNRLCFNGLYRTNAAGSFNVPYARSRAGFIPPVELFRQCAQALAAVHFRVCDFGTTLSSVRRGDFVYLDPPYTVGNRRVFAQYDRRAFTLRDLERLSTHLVALDRRGASFVLSYADCSEARRLFAKWPTRRIMVRRNVAGFSSARRIAAELVATNIQLRD